MSKAISTEAKTGKHRPSEADLTERMRRWFQKELPTRSVDVSVETVIDTFNFKENANDSFTFNCLKCRSLIDLQSSRPSFLILVLLFKSEFSFPKIQMILMIDSDSKKT